MRIGGLQKLSLIDYPGKLACTVFFSGCAFRCPWCYNSSLVSPEKIQEKSEISLEELFEFLKKRKNSLEGVVLSGGEPCINSELIDVCEKIKLMGYNIKLDTNGLNPKMLKYLIDSNLIDYVAMDIKAPKEKYLKVTGIKDPSINLDQKNKQFWAENIMKNIEKSMDILKNSDIDFEFRTTVVPGMVKKKDIVQIVKWIAPAPKYFIQEFKTGDTVNPGFKNVKLHKREYLLEILKAIEPFFETCELRT